MRKEWEKPQLKDLSLSETAAEGCPYAGELESQPATTTLFPVIIWGDGKIGCTYWSCAKHGCTNPKYGSAGTCWPCPQAKADAVTTS